MRIFKPSATLLSCLDSPSQNPRQQVRASFAVRDPIAHGLEFLRRLKAIQQARESSRRFRAKPLLGGTAASAHQRDAAECPAQRNHPPKPLSSRPKKSPSRLLVSSPRPAPTPPATAGASHRRAAVNPPRGHGNPPANQPSHCHHTVQTLPPTALATRLPALRPVRPAA